MPEDSSLSSVFSYIVGTSASSLPKIEEYEKILSEGIDGRSDAILIHTGFLWYYARKYGLKNIEDLEAHIESFIYDPNQTIFANRKSKVRWKANQNPQMFSDQVDNLKSIALDPDEINWLLWYRDWCQSQRRDFQAEKRVSIAHYFLLKMRQFQEGAYIGCQEIRRKFKLNDPKQATRYMHHILHRCPIAQVLTDYTIGRNTRQYVRTKELPMQMSNTDIPLLGAQRRCSKQEVSLAIEEMRKDKLPIICEVAS